MSSWLVLDPGCEDGKGRRHRQVPEALRSYLLGLAKDREPTDLLFGEHWRDWPREWVQRICRSAKSRRSRRTGCGVPRSRPRCAWRNVASIRLFRSSAALANASGDRRPTARDCAGAVPRRARDPPRTRSGRSAAKGGASSAREQSDRVELWGIVVDMGEDAARTCYDLVVGPGRLWSIGAKDVMAFDGRTWTRID